ncbi:metal-sensing transcriptional repressor [Candidatus Falkowbacteria bacterium]|nr:metal-sensing transcriptional repressor [Candidatus Falkowbacteria bacterium]
MPKKDPNISRLHRLQGQLAGIEKMIENTDKTSGIIQQLEAVRGSLKSLEKNILSKKIKNISDEELKKTINYLLKIS